MKKNTLKKDSRKKILTVWVLLAVVMFELVLSFIFISPDSNKSFAEYAEEIVEDCKDESYRPSCYDKNIPKLMDRMTMEEAFEVTKIVQDIDREYAFCHVLGHELSAREVRKDPANWKEVLSRCPSGVCSNGCLHGGLQEKFRDTEKLSESQIESIIGDLTTLCEKRDDWNPTGLEQGSCYHALGHLVMYIVDAEIDEAITLCDKTSMKDDGRDFRQVCYDGVFMQIYQPLEPEDFALVEGKQPTAATVDDFCEEYDQKPQASCHSESWPLFFDEISSDPDNLVAFCERSNPAYKERCYLGLVYVLTSTSNLDSDKMYDYCSKMIDSRRPQCFADVASRMMEVDYRNIDKSIELCNRAEVYDSDGVCYQEMVTYSTFNFHKGSPEFYKVCDSLPEPWSTKCLGA